ncbi:MAG: hypothetical protein JNJ45_10145 [Chthonomonas sp.]|nr:hypothetical protein [Chthonomonas sp.]
MKRSLLFALIFTTTLAHSSDPAWVKAVKKEIKKIEVSGYRSVGLHFHGIDGDRSAFNTVNYFGQGSRRVTNIGQIQLTGRKVLGVVNFRANIQDDRFQDPQGQRFSLDYEKNGLIVNAGDLPGSLITGNQFATLNKSLRGVSVGYRKGNFSARAVSSEATGSARTVSVSGNNSAGPYYLQASQLVPGSEKIQLDGVDLRPGEDYAINYEVGSITLVGRVAPLTSVIVASYEAFGFNDRRGRVSGVGAGYDLGDGQRVSVTALRQDARGAGRLSSRLEKFQGFGPASTPYTLQFEPQPGTQIVIRLDGVVQTLGVDFVFDTTNPAIFYFTRFIASSSEVAVLYTPKARSTANGDRANLGLQYTSTIRGKDLTGGVTLSTATGRLSNSATPSNGTARGASLTLRGSKFDLTTSWRRVPNGFVAVESVGFNRNEDGYQSTMEYRPTSRLKLGATTRNSAITSYNSVGNAFGNRSTSAGLTARYDQDSASYWTAERTDVKSRTTLGASNLARTALFVNRRQAKFEWGLGVENQAGRQPLTSTTSQSLLLRGLKLRTTYFGDSRLGLRASASLLRVHAGDQSGTGRDYDIAATYRPNSRLSLSSAYVVSDGGALATLGSFTNGFGIGYDGNGFSNGSSSLFGTGITNLRSWTNVASYSPTDRVSLNASLQQRRATGSVSSNSDTDSYSLGVSVDSLRGYLWSLSLDQSQTRFLGSAVPTSRSTSIAGYLTAAPPKSRLRWQLGFSSFLAGGATTFSQDGLAISGTAVYGLNPRQNLILDIRRSRTTGYLGQDEWSNALTYQYRIWQDLSFNATYTFRNTKNLDPGISTGAYRANSLDFEISYNFSRF